MWDKTLTVPFPFCRIIVGFLYVVSRASEQTSFHDKCTHHVYTSYWNYEFDFTIIISLFELQKMCFKGRLEIYTLLVEIFDQINRRRNACHWFLSFGARLDWSIPTRTVYNHTLSTYMLQYCLCPNCSPFIRWWRRWYEEWNHDHLTRMYVRDSYYHTAISVNTKMRRWCERTFFWKDTPTRYNIEYSVVVFTCLLVANWMTTNITSCSVLTELNPQWI